MIFQRIKQHKTLIFLVLIMLVVFVVRVWDINELFIFKMDQSRDIKLVQEAYDNGIGELPLLGPRAAKTYLRLGPIFYYFEYLSMWITGNSSPLSVVWPDFIFSILTIPLFYYFLRQAFNRKVSLITTIVFASSFFLTQYGRFAWNPNSIPFWSLLFFLGLYKVVEKFIKSKVKSQLFESSQYKLLKNGESGRWLLVATIGYGVASQLHFTAALAYPLIAILFFAGVFIMELYMEGSGKEFKIRKIINSLRVSVWQFWRNIGWKYWLGAIVILGIFYLPMMFSEVCTQGDNWVQFKYALSGRGKEEFSFQAKIIQSLKLHSEYFWFTLISLPKGASDIGVVGFCIVIMGTILVVLRNFQFSIFNFQSIFNDKIFNDKNKIIWFYLVIIWAVVMGALYTKLAFNVLKPRYWLLEAPLFFIWLAVVMDYINNLVESQKFTLSDDLGSKVKSLPCRMTWGQKSKVKSRLLRGMQFGIVGFLVAVNLYATGVWYWEVKNQQEVKFSKWELKLKDENKISYGQLEKVVEYIRDEVLLEARENNKDVCFYTTGEYRPVYDYLFEKRGISNKNFLKAEEIKISVVRRISFNSDTNENCLFLAIDHRRHLDTPRIPKRHKNEFEKKINGRKSLGFVTVWQVTRKKQETNSKKQKSEVESGKLKVESYPPKADQLKVEKSEAESRKSKVESRESEVESKKWKVENIIQAGDDEVDKKLIIKKPRRQERIRWKDVFGCIWNK